MIRAVLFDLDNTLVDFLSMKRAGVDAAITAMLDAGLSVSRKEADERIYAIYHEKGIEYQEVFDRFLESTVRPNSLHPHLLAAAVSAYRRARSYSLQPYPGIRETLVGLIKRGIVLGVVSDAPQKQAWMRLVDSGLEIFFDAVVAHEDTGVHKPDPQPFNMAMKRLGVTADETIMVGDWPERDMQGASALGVVTVFARYGDVFGTKNSGADYELKQPLELLQIVDKIGSPHIVPPVSGQLSIL